MSGADGSTLESPPLLPGAAGAIPAARVASEGLSAISAPPRRVTIADIARQCGVSPATVSRVLNNKPQFSVSPPVRARILETARGAGYFPDLAARNLTRGSTNIVGVFTAPPTPLGTGVNEPILEGVADVLHGGGYDVFLELGAVRRPQAALPFWRFDGAILLQDPRADAVAELDQRRVPYVCVNERAGTPAALVLADDRMGMRLAVEHLATLGHRRLAYANAGADYSPHYSVRERHETLVRHARAAGIVLAPGHDVPPSEPAEFLRATVLSAGATAVIAYDHSIAAALVLAAHGLGLRVPADFSLICFNDLFPVALLTPPLTAVAVCGREMGRVGAELLLNVLQATGARPTRREIRIAEELIVRSSTAPPPSVDPLAASRHA